MFGFDNRMGMSFLRDLRKERSCVVQAGMAVVSSRVLVVDVPSMPVGGGVLRRETIPKVKRKVSVSGKRSVV